MELDVLETRIGSMVTKVLVRNVSAGMNPLMRLAAIEQLYYQNASALTKADERNEAGGQRPRSKATERCSLQCWNCQEEGHRDLNAPTRDVRGRLGDVRANHPSGYSVIAVGSLTTLHHAAP